jgi:hypothetical protein
MRVRMIEDSVLCAKGLATGIMLSGLIWLAAATALLLALPSS